VIAAPARKPFRPRHDPFRHSSQDRLPDPEGAQAFAVDMTYPTLRIHQNRVGNAGERRPYAQHDHIKVGSVLAGQRERTDQRTVGVSSAVR
jgi:hypothetical protein